MEFNKALCKDPIVIVQFNLESSVSRLIENDISKSNIYYFTRLYTFIMLIYNGGQFGVVVGIWVQSSHNLFWKL
jgi:hypothetical protein